MTYRRSRLAQKEQQKSLRQAVVFGFLTVFIIIVLIFLGIPVMIKAAIFLGNLKKTSSSQEKVEGMLPSSPKFNPSYEATNSAQLNLSGYADSQTEIEIFLNGTSQSKIPVNEDGTFLFENFTLSPERNEIYAISLNDKGKASEPSQPLIINYDNLPPKLVINEPVNNSSFFGLNNKTVIKGETEEEASVTVNDHLAVVDSAGKFNYYFPLANGENKIKIVAHDLAGNKTETELTVTLE